MDTADNEPAASSSASAVLDREAGEDGRLEATEEQPPGDDFAKDNEGKQKKQQPDTACLLTLKKNRRNP